MTPRLVAGLFGVSAALAVGALVLGEDHAPRQAPAGPLFPDLAERPNDAASLTITGGGESVTVDRAEDGWVVREVGGYPAAFDRVRQNLVALSRMTRVEPKTADPERYARLHLEPPEAAESRAQAVTVMAADGTELASVIVGKAGEPIGADRETVYVRLPGEDRAWLAEGALDLAAETGFWLERELANLRQERIAQVTVSAVPPGPAPVVISRAAPGDDLSLRDVPEGRRVRGASAVNTVAFGLEYLDLTDVRRDEGTAGTVTHRAVYETLDGVTATVEVVSLSGEDWIRLGATHAPVADIATRIAAQGEVHEDAVLRDTDEAADEAAAIAGRAAGWLFKVPGHKLNRFRTEKDALLEAEGDS